MSAWRHIYPCQYEECLTCVHWLGAVVFVLVSVLNRCVVLQVTGYVYVCRVVTGTSTLRTRKSALNSTSQRTTTPSVQLTSQRVELTWWHSGMKWRNLLCQVRTSRKKLSVYDSSDVLWNGFESPPCEEMNVLPVRWEPNIQWLLADLSFVFISVLVVSHFIVVNLCVSDPFARFHIVHIEKNDVEALWQAVHRSVMDVQEIGGHQYGRVNSSGLAREVSSGQDFVFWVAACVWQSVVNGSTSACTGTCLMVMFVVTCVASWYLPEVCSHLFLSLLPVPALLSCCCHSLAIDWCENHGGSLSQC